MSNQQSCTRKSFKPLPLIFHFNSLSSFQLNTEVDLRAALTSRLFALWQTFLLCPNLLPLPLLYACLLSSPEHNPLLYEYERVPPPLSRCSETLRHLLPLCQRYGGCHEGGAQACLRGFCRRFLAWQPIAVASLQVALPVAAPMTLP